MESLLSIIITFFLPFVLYFYIFRNKDGLPTNWPIVRMLPALFVNTHRLNESMVEIMHKSYLSFQFKGPWLTNMNLLVTVDPANIHHILTKNYPNYTKGKKLKEIVEPLGDGILNTDSTTLWKYHRNVAHSFFNHSNFRKFLVHTILQKIDSCLIPVLDHASKNSQEIDLQDLFSRFTFDTMSIILLDHDPMSVSLELPNFPLLKAVTELEHGVIFRFIVPTCVWKFYRWLNVGSEKKFTKGYDVLDNYIYNCIGRKREQRRNETSKSKVQENEVVSVDLLTSILDKNGNENMIYQTDKFLRDTITNFFIAGGVTVSLALTWFFCLLSKHPKVVAKIKEELDVKLPHAKDMFLQKFEEVGNKLIYLHAALCETLRLYPSAFFVFKESIEEDILPSGHQVKPNSQILINLYAIGRMKSIWGDDCIEFKPERWITSKGKIVYEPSYKFPTFSAGPRACLGKHVAFTEMKVIAAIIIQRYHIEAVEQNHVPDVSLVCTMKDGFKVRVSHC